jgi:hypothetical protein
VLVVLRLPHLVLADVGDDHGVAVGLAPQIVDDVRRVEVPVVGQVLDVADGGIALELRDAAEPLGMLGLRRERQQVRQHFAQVADQRHVHVDVLVHFGRIDLDVDLLRVERVGLQVARDAVVEPHAEGEQQIRFWIAVLTQASPCMPIMPRFMGWLAGMPPRPSSVIAIGV